MGRCNILILFNIYSLFIYGGIDVAGRESAGDELWCLDPFTPNSIIPEWKLYTINNVDLIMPSNYIV